MIILSIRPCGTLRVLLHAAKPYDMEPSRFTSHPRGRCAAEPSTFGSSGQHTNHYTTKATQSNLTEFKLEANSYGQCSVSGWRPPVRATLCAVCVGTRRRGSTTGCRAATAVGVSSSAASDGTCFDPMKPKLVFIIYKNSVRTSKRTQHFTITKDQLVNAV
jgi:hypothetical protein